MLAGAPNRKKQPGAATREDAEKSPPDIASRPEVHSQRVFNSLQIVFQSFGFFVHKRFFLNSQITSIV
jgi:hypothetical protein